MTDDLRPGLTIILPCYNAGRVLDATLRRLAKLFERFVDLELVLVNDGSSADDPINRIIKAHSGSPFFQGRLKTISHQENRGKGAAVMTGLAAVTTTQVCFTDADLAYGPENIPRLREHLVAGTLVVANRVDQDSTYLIQPHYFRHIVSRHLASRLFNLAVRMTLIPGIRDVQAGLKMGCTADLRRCVSKSTCWRFSFDTELLFIAVQQGLVIHSSPVRYKYYSDESTVNFVMDSLRMARDLLRIRIKGWLGKYR